MLLRLTPSYSSVGWCVVYRCVYLSIETNTWAMPPLTGIPPSARAGHTAVCVDDNVMLFGGGDLERVHNDIVVLDTGTPLLHVRNGVMRQSVVR